MANKKKSGKSGQSQQARAAPRARGPAPLRSQLRSGIRSAPPRFKHRGASRFVLTENVGDLVTTSSWSGDRLVFEPIAEFVPMLRGHSQGFEEYYVHSARLRYVSLCPSTTPGTVTAGFRSDSSSAFASSARQLSNFDGAYQASVTTNFTVHWTGDRKWRLVRRAGVSTEQDLVKYAAGQFQYGTEGGGDSSVTAGALWLELDIEFREPAPRSALAGYSEPGNAGEEIPASTSTYFEAKPADPTDPPDTGFGSVFTDWLEAQLAEGSIARERLMSWTTDQLSGWLSGQLHFGQVIAEEETDFVSVLGSVPPRLLDNLSSEYVGLDLDRLLAVVKNEPPPLRRRSPLPDLVERAETLPEELCLGFTPRVVLDLLGTRVRIGPRTRVSRLLHQDRVATKLASGATVRLASLFTLTERGLVLGRTYRSLLPDLRHELAPLVANDITLYVRYWGSDLASGLDSDILDSMTINLASSAEVAVVIAGNAHGITTAVLSKTSGGSAAEGHLGFYAQAADAREFYGPQSPGLSEYSGVVWSPCQDASPTYVPSFLNTSTFRTDT